MTLWETSTDNSERREIDRSQSPGCLGVIIISCIYALALWVCFR